MMNAIKIASDPVPDVRILCETQCPSLALDETPPAQECSTKPHLLRPFWVCDRQHCANMRSWILSNAVLLSHIWDSEAAAAAAAAISESEAAAAAAALESEAAAAAGASTAAPPQSKWDISEDTGPGNSDMVPLECDPRAGWRGKPGPGEPLIKSQRAFKSMFSGTSIMLRNICHIPLIHPDANMPLDAARIIQLFTEFYKRCRDQPWWDDVLAQCFGIGYDPTQRSHKQNQRARKLDAAIYPRDAGAKHKLQPIESALLMCALKDVLICSVRDVHDSNSTQGPRCVETLLREAAAEEVPDVPILNSKKFDGETGAFTPSPGLLSATTWEIGGQAEFDAIKHMRMNGEEVVGTGTKRLAFNLMHGCGGCRHYMYVKFFGAASETGDGVSGASGAEGGNKAARADHNDDLRAERRASGANGGSKAARSDDNSSLQAERRASGAEGGSKAARSDDDDDFQAERRVRRGR